ncbi:MAG: glycosyltransferase family 2 protein [Chromatocurvus sp.]
MASTLNESLQPASARMTWTCAVFAHNEAKNITDCLESLEAAASGLPHPLAVHVLANGCTDETESIVAAYVSQHAHVRLVSLPIADKAAAWNHYIHHVAPDADMHVMVDGDVQACAGSVGALAARLNSQPSARAAAAQPASGRSRISWSTNMIHFGRIAGCLYALRGNYVSLLRAQGFAIPKGLIGEDLFLSVVIKDNLRHGGLFQPAPALAVEPRALFHFRSLSRRRPGDWSLYAKRLVRYRIRDYQLMLLLEHLERCGPASLPAHVDELYASVKAEPALRWSGRRTALDWLAVGLLRAKIRSARKQQG